MAEIHQNSPVHDGFLNTGVMNFTCSLGLKTMKDYETHNMCAQEIHQKQNGILAEKAHKKKSVIISQASVYSVAMAILAAQTNSASPTQPVL